MRPANLAMRIVSVVLPAMLACGCEATVSKVQYDRLNQRWLDSMREKREIVRRDEQLQETVAHQNEQIATLQTLGDKRLDLLFHVTGIELGRHTGGVNTDGRGGDDAVKVFLQPVDRRGDVVKAAGAATVQLFDLAQPPADNLIGQYDWTVEQLGEQWTGGVFGAAQFAIVCPWRSGPPAHDDVTVRVTFTDYLTGKTFTAQKLVTVRVDRSAPQPASAPASEPASQPGD